MNQDKTNQYPTRRALLGGALSAAALLSAVDAGAQEPGTAPRSRETFDFGWKFSRGDFPGAEAAAFSDAGWRTLDLPHDWSIEGPFAENEKSAGSGGYAPTGIGWYRKHFRVPSGFQNRKVTVEFDGVYQNSEVWINGHYLGKRPYGYISFAYHLTPHLIADGENVVAIKVDNSRQPGSRWYSGSGIYRHTWLVATDPLHVAQWGTFVTTPRVSKDAATVKVKTRVRNERKAAAVASLTTTVVDGEGKPVEAAETTQEIAPGGEYEFVQQIAVAKPELWSVTAPRLYQVRSTVREGQQVVDEYVTPFGIREAVFDADRGFLLNGERVKLNGVCLHHDCGAVGAAVPERMWERRFGRLRDMGCNAIRTSHNPPAPEFLDLCDRMGFLVMNEAFDEWRVPKGQIGPFGYSLYFDEWRQRDVTDFVHRDRNHPSVVLWSAGNEIGDQTHPGGVETLRELIGIFHREDPTRPVTAGCDQIAAEPKATPQEFLGLLDVVGYNYVDRWRDRREKYYSIDRAAYPERRVIGTESSGMGGVRGDYSSLLPGAAPPASGRRFRIAGGAYIDTEQLWKFVSTYDYVAGDFMWTGIDYLGEAFWPSKSASAGVMDTCGIRKDGYYFYQSQWTAKPMIHVFPHWNWKGHEGQFIPVTCYTNCDTVELFLNGKSLGVKGYAFPRPGMIEKYGTYPPRAMAVRTTADLHLTWGVPYEAGTLKAVGTKDGKVAMETEVTTTGEPAGIRLSADRETIRADRRDVAHLTVHVIDAAGRLVPEGDDEITLEIAGEGRLIGFDSGDPASHEDFKAPKRKAFHGLAVAVVQATGKGGTIRVTASAPRLKPASVSIATAG
jgi:beta-galactosidase